MATDSLFAAAFQMRQHNLQSTKARRAGGASVARVVRTVKFGDWTSGQAGKDASFTELAIRMDHVAYCRITTGHPPMDDQPDLSQALCHSERPPCLVSTLTVRLVTKDRESRLSSAAPISTVRPSLPLLVPPSVSGFWGRLEPGSNQAEKQRPLMTCVPNGDCFLWAGSS